MLLDLVIQIHYMQDIEKLSLILMQPLDLYIEDRARIDLHSVVFLDILGQTHLILIFDSHELLSGLLIISGRTYLADTAKIRYPFFSDPLSHPVGKQRIGMQKESSLCDTISLVIKLLREHLIEVLKLLILKYLGMKPCHTVDGISGHNSKMCHLDLSVIYDSHLADLLIRKTCLTRIFLLYLYYETSVDLLHYLIDTGQKS